MYNIIIASYLSSTFLLPTPYIASLFSSKTLMKLPGVTSYCKKAVK